MARERVLRGWNEAMTRTLHRFALYRCVKLGGCEIRVHFHRWTRRWCPRPQLADRSAARDRPYTGCVLSWEGNGTMVAERFQVRESVDSSRWDAMVSLLGGTIQHSSAFAGYTLAADADNCPAFMSLQADDGTPIGAALGFRVRSPRRLLAPLTGRMWLPAMPAVCSEAKDALLEFLGHIEQYARRNGCVVLEVNSAASRSGREEFTRLGFELTERLEFELDLQRSEDDLWQEMEYKRRKNIKKAIRTGVTIRDLAGENGIAELRRLQGDSSQRIVGRGGPDITRQRRSAEDPVNVLLDAGLGRIVCGEVDGKIVSAGLFTQFNGLVYHTLSGHSEEALRSQAPTLLVWETIKRYRREGAKRFNFGGCKADAVEEDSPEHGVYVYKKAFGAECIPCTSGRKVLNKVRHALLRGLKRTLARG